MQFKETIYQDCAHTKDLPEIRFFTLTDEDVDEIFKSKIYQYWWIVVEHGTPKVLNKVLWLIQICEK